MQKLYTTAGETPAGIPWNAYPRPQMKRKEWLCLNGKGHFEYGEIRFDGNVVRKGARKMQLKVDKNDSEVSSKKNTKYIAPIAFIGFRERFISESSWYEEMDMLPFEYTTVPGPRDYVMQLTKLYGDYTEFKKGAAVHTMEIMDPEVPYMEKLHL